MALSRVENILQAKQEGTAYNKKPLSRVEALLLGFSGSGSGGGGGNISEEDDFSDMDVDDIMSVLSTEND